MGRGNLSSDPAPMPCRAAAVWTESGSKLVANVEQRCNVLLSYVRTYLKFLNALQGQPHVECITTIHTGGDAKSSSTAKLCSGSLWGSAISCWTKNGKVPNPNAPQTQSHSVLPGIQAVRKCINNIAYLTKGRDTQLVIISILMILHPMATD